MTTAGHSDRSQAIGLREECASSDAHAQESASEDVDS
jgi:hypothetical protein